MQRRVALTIYLLAMLAGTSGLSRSHAQTSADVWELQPYQIRVVLVPEQSPPWSKARLQQLSNALQQLAATEIGARWRVDVGVMGHGPRQRIWTTIRAGTSRDMALSRLFAEIARQSEHGVCDKLIFVLLDLPASPRGVRVSVCDRAIRQWGPIHHERFHRWADLPRTVFELILRATSSQAVVRQIDGNRIVLRPRAALLPVRSRQRAGALEDSVFQLGVRAARDGTSSVLPHTFVVVERDEDPALVGHLVSRFADPLADVPQEAWVAVGARPGSSGTRWRLTFQDDTGRAPLAGCHVLLSASHAQRGKPVGRSGRDGEIRLPASNRLMWLQVAWGSVLLDQLPTVPGWREFAEWELAVRRADLLAAEMLDLCRADLAELDAQWSVAVRRVTVRREQGRTKEATALLSEARQLVKKRVPVLRERFRNRRAAAGAEDDPFARQWSELDQALNRLLASAEPGPDADAKDAGEKAADAKGVEAKGSGDTAAEAKGKKKKKSGGSPLGARAARPQPPRIR